MRKFLIIIIVLLIILIIGQAVYYKINQANDISSLNFYNEQMEETEVDKLYILGMSVLYNDDNYKPKISFENLENKFYTFISINVPKITENIEEKTIEQIKQYYNENVEEINSMYIYNEDDFVMIAKQLQNIFNTSDNDIYDYYIDTDNIKKTEDGLISFLVNFVYENDEKLQVVYTISENNENIKISSGLGLNEQFETYTGDVTKQEVLEKIDLFISNIENIRLNTTLKTENARRQYYDLNKEELEKIGITTQDDFIQLVLHINSMSWNYTDLKFENYELNLQDAIQEEYYYSFEVIIHYNHESKLNLKISIRNQSNIEPNIKISSYERE